MTTTADTGTKGPAMTEAEERAAFEAWYDAQPEGRINPFDVWQARAALSAPPGPMMPAGWFESPDGAFRANPLYQLRFPSQLLKWQIPLYCLLPVNAAPDAPPGWRLVPIEPTPEMLDAVRNGPEHETWRDGYHAMLAAAPSPQEQT